MMEGKPYKPGTVCSDVTADGIAAANPDKEAYQWNDYKMVFPFLVFPNDIGDDPRFNQHYQWKQSAVYLNGGYKIITPSGSSLSVRPR